MKYLLIILSIILLASCTTCPSCPPEDLVVVIMTPMGPMPYLFEKGTFDQEQDYIIPKVEFDKYLEEQGRLLEEQSGDDDSDTMKL